MPVSDSTAYDTFAQNLANANVYGWEPTSPTAYWPPGTSFIYSLFYRVFGHNYVPIIVLNLFVAAIVIWVSMYLAQTWFNRRIAILTGLLLALWPSQIEFTTVLASELIFTALVLVALALWLNERMNLQLRTVLDGVILAAAAYVRPTALSIPILLGFFRWVKTGKIFKTSKAILIMFVLMAVLIAPWSIRNTRLFGQFVLISTNGGANFWMGNNPNSTGSFWDCFLNFPPEVKGMNEAQRDDYLESVAKAYIREKPLLFLKRFFTRLIDTHRRESIGIAWNQEGLKTRYGEWILSPIKIVNQIYWMAVLGLALVGIILLGKEYGWVATISHPTVVLWGYYAAVHAIIISQDRYHFPSIPMIAILAAFTLGYWLDKKNRKQSPN